MRNRPDEEVIHRDLKAFGEALGSSMQVRGIAQRSLAEMLEVSQGAVSGWVTGTMEPAPATVFRVEQALELPAGHLSKHLGFLPLTVTRTVVSVEESILNDPDLDLRLRRSMIAMYRAAVGSDGSVRSGRPRKKS